MSLVKSLAVSGLAPSSAPSLSSMSATSLLFFLVVSGSFVCSNFRLNFSVAIKTNEHSKFLV
jgi:hypothetical protein